MVATAGDFWAITAFFNPAGFRRRRANYRLFRDHLTLPLVTVELAFDAAFELGQGDAELLIQLRGGGVLWQKERLLNLALAALPPECRKVVWLDCDIVFATSDWAERTSLLLDRFALVQPFGRAYPMPRGWEPGQLTSASGLDEWHSVPSLVQSGVPLAQCVESFAPVTQCCHGYAWAANRSLLDAHHFYDFCVMGGADSAMLRAAYGRPEAAVRLQQMNCRQEDHYLTWANKFFDSVQSNVGSGQTTLYHLWHGDRRNRRYIERNADFRPFGYDPLTDVALGKNGAWRWASDKSEMHSFVRNYFASRMEDG